MWMFWKSSSPEEHKTELTAERAEDAEKNVFLV